MERVNAVVNRFSRKNNGKKIIRIQRKSQYKGCRIRDEITERMPATGDHDYQQSADTHNDRIGALVGTSGHR